MAADGGSEATEGRAGREPGEGVLLLTLALLTGVTAVVSSLGAPLVPAIAESYGTSLASAQWILTAALLSGAVATPLVGRLGGGRWRRETALVLLGVVTAGCLLSAASAALGGGFLSMAVGRALQGTGMSLTPVAIAVARDSFTAPRMQSAVALLSVTTVAGAGLGYPITGLIVELGGLAAAYVVGALMTGATLVLCLLALPVRRETPTPPLDWVGGGLLAAAMVAVLMAVTQGRAWGWTSPGVVALGATGCLGMGAWVWWTSRQRHPLIDLRLAVRPGVLSPHVTGLVAGAGMYYFLSLAMIVVQVRTAAGWGLGQSVAVASLLLVPYSTTSVLGSRVALAMARRTRGVLLPLGGVMFLAATMLLAFVHDHLWQVLLAMALGGLGSGFTFSSLPLLLIPHVPVSETSSALATNQLLRFSGMAVGSTLCVVLMQTLGGGTQPGEAGFRNALLAMSGVWVLVVIGLLTLRRWGSGTAVADEEVEVVLAPRQNV